MKTKYIFTPICRGVKGLRKFKKNKKNKKNKRTLKRRTRKIFFLMCSIIIIVWGIICLLIIENLIYVTSIILTKYISTSISENIIEKNMDIDEFLHELKKQDLYSVYTQVITKKNLNEDLKKIVRLEELTNKNVNLNMDGILIDINIDNKSFFSNSIRKEDMSRIIQKIADRYKTTEAITLIRESDGNIVGEVIVKINPNLIFLILLSIAIMIIVFIIISLVVVNIVIRIVTIPIISPLNQLEKKMKAVAKENFNESKGIEIELKKPLKEIESLISATNLITEKMKEYNEVIIDQKTELEKQNCELEAQNEELIESKNIIQEAQTQLIESERMASIGQLTAAITHEINTPLGTINSNVQLFQMLISMISEREDIEEDSELKQLFFQLKQANDVSVLACTRIKEIIRSLKNFSRLDESEFQETDINDNLDSVFILTSNLWKYKVTIHKDYGNIPKVNCFSGLLNQVFINIIVNAIQSIKGQGDIYIKTYFKEDRLFVSIKDTGTGIENEYINKIFDFGFTTKKDNNGMGIGLALSYDIVKKHNGDIKVISEKDKGTEFIISIPLKICSIFN